MDSAGMHCPFEVVAKLRSWLKLEWRTKKKYKGAKATTSSSSSAAENSGLDAFVDALFGGHDSEESGGILAILRPKVPKQVNGVDCGLYALQFGEEVLWRSPNIYPKDLRENTIAGFSSDMFTAGDINVKRRKMKDLIDALILTSLFS
mmetsp:Transcript_45453/g.84441  ORF Transcript_45453/g.84441 Transcript_45453/m.84441 type:complete len:148 (-) Transcript_45453:34-477(-)